jgi:hypothetical protein
MSEALAALRAVDFNWTHGLHDVWSDPAFHVEALHKSTIDAIMDEFRLWTARPGSNPIGQVISGRAGVGKTHLLGTLRRRVWAERGWFVLIDIVGVSDFWATAAFGFLESLSRRMPSGLPQHKAIVSGVLEALSDDPIARSAIAGRPIGPPITKLEAVELMLDMLRRIDPANTLKHQDVFRSLVLLDSEESASAHAWLQGAEIDEAKRRELKFSAGASRAVEVVRGLLWIMSLTGPTLIAVDQIDSIVSEANAAPNPDLLDPRDAASVHRARAIVQTLAGGLMDLHDVKRRAMTVVSCLEITWPILKANTVAAAADRFQELPTLAPIGEAGIVAHLVGGRLARAYRALGYEPPYPTAPFRPEAIASAVGLRPRAILQRCQAHRLRCLAAGEALECFTLAEGGETAPRPAPPAADLEADYQRELRRADPSAWVADEASETPEWGALLVQTCELLLAHLALPETVDGVVRPDPDPNNPSLHARLSFESREAGDREQHYCFRGVGQSHAVAFQTRLKAAMTASGIDAALKFRKLIVIRRGAPPSGAKTRALVEQFERAGGQFIAPSEDDFRVFLALRAMADADPPGFESWLGSRKPLFETTLFKAAGLAPPAFLGAAAAKPAEPPRPEPAPPPPPAEPRFISLGRRLSGNPAQLSTDLLPRHVAILSGTGSGKTALLRRIVEEAALIGIPAIVVDVNNDLSRLGDPWPERPEAFDDEDAAKASAYHSRVDVAIWTPGASSGAPLSPRLLPDFAAIGEGADPETADDRAQAIEMARATLEPFIGASGAKAALKRGVLADALRVFARRGGSLDDLVALLADLPDEACAIGDARKLAGEIADQLRAAIATNPLLKSSGPPLDPELLFNGAPGKTRVSVINLSGLASDAAKQSFVNQLQMTLFTWIKRHPSPTGRLYALDEAQNFAPAQLETPCKRSAILLAAQARECGLGMIFATRDPKGVDAALISNCVTHFYGRASAPATIQAVQEMMAARGGAADDLGRLNPGEFYMSTEGATRPLKIRAPLCLSWHPANPPTAEEIFRKARESAG